MVSQSEAVFTHALAEAAAMASSEEKVAFLNRKYRRYFNLLEVRGRNIHVKCTLCIRAKYLSTSVTSNSNLMKHLSTAHATSKLVAKNTVVDAVGYGSSVANVSSANN